MGSQNFWEPRVKSWLLKFESGAGAKEPKVEAELGAEEPKVGAEPLPKKSRALLWLRHPKKNGSAPCFQQHFHKTREPGAEKQGAERLSWLPKAPTPHLCFLPSVFVFFFSIVWLFFYFFPLKSGS